MPHTFLGLETNSSNRAYRNREKATETLMVS